MYPDSEVTGTGTVERQVFFAKILLKIDPFWEDRL
jgi:hypothetical protein